MKHSGGRIDTSISGQAHLSRVRYFRSSHFSRFRFRYVHCIAHITVDSRDNVELYLHRGGYMEDHEHHEKHIKVYRTRVNKLSWSKHWQGHGGRLSPCNIFQPEGAWRECSMQTPATRRPIEVIPVIEPEACEVLTGKHRCKMIVSAPRGS